MHELPFPLLTCPQCSCRIPHGLPFQVCGLILLDAMNLDEGQEGDDAPRTHDEVEAQLKKLFGAGAAAGEEEGAERQPGGWRR